MRQQLPPYIDLNKWLRERGYANTAGEADRMLLAGRVKSDSHTLGTVMVMTIKGPVKVVERIVPASLRGGLTVLPEGHDE